MLSNKLISGIFLCLFSIAAHATLPIQHWQTASGARVLFVENHDMPMIDIRVDFAAGSSRDTAKTSGLAGMTRYMMTRGAGDLDEDQISGSLAGIGAELGGNFDRDMAGFSMRTLSSRQDEAVGILAKILKSPRFDDKILEREKMRAMAEIRDSQTSPGYVVNKTFNSLLYGDHPYALPPQGEVDTVKALTRQDVVDFYKDHYTAGKEVIAIVGDLTRAQAEAVSNKLSEGLPPDRPLPALPEVPLPDKPVEKDIPFPSTQSHILIGYPGVTRDDPDYFPLLVGNYVLGGGGFESRLLNEVREKRGLAYSVYSYFYPLEKKGPFEVGLQTRKDQTKEALGIVRKTIDDFIAKGPTHKDLVSAKENLIGGFPLRIDSNKKIVDYLAMIGFYSLPLTYLDDFTKKVGAVTVGEIRDAFSRRVNPRDMVTVVVGSGG